MSSYKHHLSHPLVQQNTCAAFTLYVNHEYIDLKEIQDTFCGQEQTKQTNKDCFAEVVLFEILDSARKEAHNNTFLPLNP